MNTAVNKLSNREDNHGDDPDIHVVPPSEDGGVSLDTDDPVKSTPVPISPDNITYNVEPSQRRLIVSSRSPCDVDIKPGMEQIRGRSRSPKKPKLSRRREDEVELEDHQRIRPNTENNWRDRRQKQDGINLVENISYDKDDDDEEEAEEEYQSAQVTPTPALASREIAPIPPPRNSASTRISTSNLVSATLVDPVFAEVNPIDPEEEMNKIKRRRCVLCANACGLLLIGIGLLLYFLLGRNQGAPTTSIPAPTTAPSAAPTGAPSFYNPLNLPTESWQAIVQDPDSPQARAHEWLLEDYYFYYSQGHSIPSTKTTNIRTRTISNTTTEESETIMNEWRFHQRFALATLFFSTNGDEWTRKNNWLSHDRHECLWHKSDVNDIAGPCYEKDDDNAAFVQKVYASPSSLMDEVEKEGEYTSLQLISNGLKGTLPPEVFALLTSLKNIDLSGNNLYGTLPLEDVSIQNNATANPLERLEINSNGISGTIPSAIYGMTNLIALELSENLLEGTISTEIGYLTMLSSLMLQKNEAINGTIPSQFGLVGSSLFHLEIHENELSGTLPTELGLLTKLTKLHAYRNSLSGPIPSEWGMMRELEVLRVHMNGLTGSLPSEVGLLVDLELIILEDNQLTSSIPTELGTLTLLEKLRLSHNKLTGRIPSQIGLIQQLEILAADQNFLTGPIPQELGSSTGLERILLYENILTGLFPIQFFNYPLKNFEALKLHNNSLTGTIPPELGKLSKLSECTLNYNQLNGTLPSSLGDLSNLETLRLDTNRFGGSLPGSLTRLSSIKFLNVSVNGLTGTIPWEIGKLRSLEQINVSGTSISGVVPYGLCEIQGLGFDCSDILCGCNCTCVANPTTSNDTGSLSTQPTGMPSYIVPSVNPIALPQPSTSQLPAPNVVSLSDWPSSVAPSETSNDTAETLEQLKPSAVPFTLASFSPTYVPTLPSEDTAETLEPSPTSLEPSVLPFTTDTPSSSELSTFTLPSEAPIDASGPLEPSLAPSVESFRPSTTSGPSKLPSKAPSFEPSTAPTAMAPVTPRPNPHAVVLIEKEPPMTPAPAPTEGTGSTPNQRL